MIADDDSTYNLKHGVKLIIYNTSERLSVNSVADFLIAAIEHFKQLGDSPEEASHSGGSFGGEIIEGQWSLGEMRLVCDDMSLPASLWTDSVIDAFTLVNTLQQIRDELPVLQKQIGREPNSYLHEVIRFLAMPNGEFSALSVMLSRITP